MNELDRFDIILAIILLIIIALTSCTEPTSNPQLIHQHAIILHDDQGHTFIATHLSADTWNIQ